MDSILVQEFLHIRFTDNRIAFAFCSVPSPPRWYWLLIGRCYRMQGLGLQLRRHWFARFKTTGTKGTVSPFVHLGDLTERSQVTL